MPLFKAKPQSDASETHSHPKDRIPMDEAPVAKEKSVFSFKNSSKNPSQSPPPHQSNASTTGSSSFFRRRRSSSVSSSDRESSTRNSGGFLGIGRSNRLEDDPSIRSAREKVTDAENAEKEADRALDEARQRVKLAHQHVKGLKHEALEE
jgi:hypothetical protein